MDKITRTNTLNTKSVGQSLKYPPKIRPPSPWYNVDLVNPRGMTITLLSEFRQQHCTRGEGIQPFCR